MLVDLHRSGLDEADALSMQLEYCDVAPEGLKPAGFRGYVIPYFDRSGQPTNFYRFRYLDDTRTGFERVSGVKTRRYTQPPNTTPQVYWAPFTDWNDYLSDITNAVAITEGEKKAARCTKEGLPCIGLGGVWSFQNAHNNEPVLPDLEDIEWQGRLVYIVYDSDAADKIQIQQAEFRLARRLVAFGAVVKIVRLPPSGEDKRGLDDFLEHEGIEKLWQLLERTEMFDEAKALHQLNTEVAYVKDPGIVYVLETDQQISADGFKNHRFADRMYTRTTYNKKGEPTLDDRPAAQDWLKWPGRNAVEKLEFEPGLPRITPTGALNLWRGWRYSPKAGDVTPWLRLLDHIFAGEPFARKWAEQWCAYPFQYPGAKQRTALVVWGLLKGTGKSLIGYTLGDLYDTAFAEVGDDQIERQDFNSWADKKQFVLGDDITGSNNRRVANALKTMVTRERILINIKHIPQYYTRDCINYYFTSNSPDAFLLDEDDRRYFIHEVTAEPLSDDFYLKYYDPWRKSEKGRRALMHHLLNEVDCTDFVHTAKAPMTQAKREMIGLTRTDLESWIAMYREEPDALCAKFNNSDFLSMSELMLLYDPQGQHRVTAMTFARKLKELGVPRVDPVDREPGAQLRLGPQGELVRLYAFKNKEKWARATAGSIREHYEKTRKFKPTKLAR